MDQGIAGLVGAALGGVIGVAGTLGAARLTGKDQRRGQHEHWRRTERRGAYSHLLSKVSEAMRVGGQALDAYEDELPEAGALIGQFDEMVHTLDEAESLVALEGPESAEAAAMELVGAVYQLSNVLVLAHAVDEGEYTPSRHEPPLSTASLWDAKGKAYEASDAFIRLCRRLLDE